MKITGATSLLELQTFVRELALDIHINYVGSAACYRCVVVGPSAEDETQPMSTTGIGRDLGEALANALQNHLLQEKPR